ncbi:hypothetical protein PVL30_003583 [Lodderomyces elongisporus]|uniref:uncharacterized protein n=1 Tax=Lodderomyces elongisporus TaxID=36914 RepID=UPI00291DD583|nr:uncharacterized protein PVL30_003583 [Lodderomyces elongisporus]WLF79817.1 hypothetical protein PVL30_003583 [Lodderomyces elongisporus]
MSDSVDRVFVKAIATIRALSSRSNYGSLPRPPAENRVKLYGLYKQATEGDVKGIMPRPVGFTPEDEGAKKKWDAWKREEGLHKTEAKKRYIAYLIETMKVYASGTHEARELLSELEYLWEQIKDMPNSDEEYNPHHHHIQLPSQSPSFSQTDRLSNRTPSVGGGGGLRGQVQAGGGGGGGIGGGVSTLSNIYSHARRNTALSINDYVQQQRMHTHSQNQGTGIGIGADIGAGLDINSQVAGFGGPGSITSLPPRVGTNNVIEDFKNWQSDVNAIINKLTREFVNSRKERSPSGHEEEEQSDAELDELEITKRRILRIVKIVGVNALKFLKNFAVSLIAILFLVWLLKKNVVVKNTIVKHANTKGKDKKELVINMVLNTDENKWFIRLLNFINSFVGFV